MSSQNDHIRCRGCAFESVIEYRGITLRYTLTDGTTVNSYRQRGWCYDCNTNRDIEKRLDAAATEIELLERNASQPQVLFAALRRVFDKKPPKVSDEQKCLSELLSLAKGRISPPRCLTCGGDRTVPLIFGQDDICSSFIHDCGGRLYPLPRDESAPRISYRPTIIELDSEGRRLDRSDA